MEKDKEEKGQIQSAEIIEDAVTVEEQESSASFDDFGFKEEILQGIREAGFSEPTPIQLKAIPEIMAGHDLIGQALTGTGKTAAFGLPVMNRISGLKGLRFLVLVPTRELAAQVSAELFKLGRFTGIHTAAFTGGQSYTRQEKLLDMGIDVLVATPGRLIDLIDSGHFTDVNPEFIVVDEADEMLDMGFLEDVKKIFASFPGPRQTMLFSATMPRPVVELAETILKEPVNITTAVSETANNDIEQFFFVIEERERTDAIIRLIDAQNVGKAMIFCRTKEETDALNILLGGRGYNVNCLHGDMEQAQRSRVMAAFRRGEFDILVATDVAARGLDVDDVTHVFNFHLPFDSRGYVHRIGRTGRAGKTGTAITLVTPRELRQLEAIKRTVGAQMENKLIPTRTEVTSLRIKNIFHDLHDYPLDMNVLNQVQTLVVNQDVLVLLAKLVGHALSGGADQGPEHIGIEGERLQDLLCPRPRERRMRPSERRRQRRDNMLPTPPEEFSRFERPIRPRKKGEGESGSQEQELSEVASEKPSRKEKPFREKRDLGEGGEERPFRKEKPFREKRDFGEGGEERPFRKEKPFREKRDFSEGGEERPFRKDKPFREKRDFGEGGEERPFRKDKLFREKKFAKDEKKAGFKGGRPSSHFGGKDDGGFKKPRKSSGKDWYNF